VALFTGYRAILLESPIELGWPMGRRIQRLCGTISEANTVESYPAIAKAEHLATPRHTHPLTLSPAGQGLCNRLA